MINCVLQEVHGMQVVHPVCCGIDGHAAQLTACRRRVRDDGTIQTAWRDFGTTYDPLLACRTWLDEQGCPIAVLESTGVYTPVLSRATTGQACAASQSLSASSSP
jgi:hypothetical protein